MLWANLAPGLPVLLALLGCQIATLQRVDDGEIKMGGKGSGQGGGVAASPLDAPSPMGWNGNEGTAIRQLRGLGYQPSVQGGLNRILCVGDQRRTGTAVEEGAFNVQPTG